MRCAEHNLFFDPLAPGHIALPAPAPTAHDLEAHVHAEPKQGHADDQQADRMRDHPVTAVHERILYNGEHLGDIRNRCCW